MFQLVVSILFICHNNYNSDKKDNTNSELEQWKELRS